MCAEDNNDSDLKNRITRFINPTTRKHVNGFCLHIHTVLAVNLQSLMHLSPGGNVSKYDTTLQAIHWNHTSPRSVLNYVHKVPL